MGTLMFEVERAKNQNCSCNIYVFMVVLLSLFIIWIEQKVPQNSHTLSTKSFYVWIESNQLPAMIGACARSSSVLSIKTNASTSWSLTSISVTCSIKESLCPSANSYNLLECCFLLQFNNSSCQQQVPQWGAVVHDKRVPPPLHVQINICWLSAAVLMRPYVRRAFRYRGATPWSIKIKRTLLNRTLRRHFPNKQFIVFSYTDTSNR